MNTPFMKMAGAGNDFLVFDDRPGNLREVTPERWANLCARRTGVGADGILLLHEADRGDFRMVFMNSDGIEAEMCGNGGRILAWAAAVEHGLGHEITVESPKPAGWELPEGIGAKQVWSVTFEASDGLHSALGWGNQVLVTLSDPSVPLDLELETEEGTFTGFLLTTGVPHFVGLVEDPGKIEVEKAGPAIRFHPEVGSEGANANFVTARSDHDGCYPIRTYERGVEAETLACGTGAAAAATVLALRGAESPVSLRTRGGILHIHYTMIAQGVRNLWLEGPVNTVYRGVLADI